MIRDGCTMKITKSLSRAALKSGVTVRGVCGDMRKEKQLTHPATHTQGKFGDSTSYDDVILEDDSGNMPHDSASLVCKRRPHPINSNPSCLIEDPKQISERT
ncbi:hypothetical protein QTP70_033612, partial [Hemibagrus guttatus]